MVGRQRHRGGRDELRLCCRKGFVVTNHSDQNLDPFTVTNLGSEQTKTLELSFKSCKMFPVSWDVEAWQCHVQFQGTPSLGLLKFPFLLFLEQCV